MGPRVTAPRATRAAPKELPLLRFDLQRFFIFAGNPRFCFFLQRQADLFGCRPRFRQPVCGQRVFQSRFESSTGCSVSISTGLPGFAPQPLSRETQPLNATVTDAVLAPVHSPSSSALAQVTLVLPTVSSVTSPASARNFGLAPVLVPIRRRLLPLHSVPRSFYTCRFRCGSTASRISRVPGALRSPSLPGSPRRQR